MGLWANVSHSPDCALSQAAHLTPHPNIAYCIGRGAPSASNLLFLSRLSLASLSLPNPNSNAMNSGRVSQHSTSEGVQNMLALTVVVQNFGSVPVRVTTPWPYTRTLHPNPAP